MSEKNNRTSVIEKMAQIMCNEELRRCMKFSLEQILDERERTWRRHIKEATDLLDALEVAGLAVTESPKPEQAKDLIREQFTAAGEVNIPTREKMGLPPISKPEQSIPQAVIKQVVANLEGMIKNYPNPNINHADYKVHAFRCALETFKALKPYVDGDLSKAEGKPA